MKELRELTRRPAPAGRPQPLALLDGTLWVASWENGHLYGIDRQNWNVTADVAAPGTPFGLTAYDGALRTVVTAGNEEDDRYFYRFTPGSGFDESSRTACPDLTGSHLAADGETLYLGQMHERRILAMDRSGNTLREIALPTRCGGFAFGPGGAFYMITADDEFEVLHFATLDISQSHPKAEVVAAIPFGARSLLHDGNVWWTCDREAGDIVTFAV